MHCNVTAALIETFVKTPRFTGTARKAAGRMNVVTTTGRGRDKQGMNRTNRRNESPPYLKRIGTARNRGDDTSNLPAACLSIIHRNALALGKVNDIASAGKDENAHHKRRSGPHRWRHVALTAPNLK